MTRTDGLAPRRLLSRVADWAVGVYPEPVRARYGDEITELLAHSQRPWRDVVDVARSASVERLRTVNFSYAVAATAISLAVAVPVLAAFALMTVLILPLAAALSAAVGIAARDLTGRRWWIAALITFGAASVLLLSLSPDDDVRSDLLPPLLLFALGTLALVAALTAVGRRRWPAAGVGVLGGLMLMVAVTVVCVLGQLGPTEAPREHAMWWYATTVFPFVSFDIGAAATPYGPPAGLLVPDILGFFPQLLTVCLGFVLGCAYGSAAGAQRSAQARRFGPRPTASPTVSPTVSRAEQS